MSTAPPTELHPAEYARCPICNEAYFPVHSLAPCGHSAEPTLHPFGGPGEVHAWTRSHGADGAMLIAMADFLDGELRVTAPMTGAEEIAIGDQLEVLSADDGRFFLAPRA